MRYPATLSRDGKGFLVAFPDVPEAITHGATEAAALRNAIAALETALQIYITDGQPVPAPSPPKRGQRVVELPGLSAGKVALWHQFLMSKQSKLALAKAIGWHPPQLDRIFDLRHRSKFDQLDQVAAALGKRLDVTLKDAAD